MKIIRMENCQGVGMYYHDKTRKVISNGDSDPKVWPMPYDDSALKADIKTKKRLVYPDTHMLDSSSSYMMLHDHCMDVINSGLFDIYHEHDFKFCFKDYSQMERWIYNFDWRVGLNEGGILMNVYEIDEKYVMIGTTQCTFNIKHAVLVDTFSPTALEADMLYAL